MTAGTVSGVPDVLLATAARLEEVDDLLVRVSATSELGTLLSRWSAELRAAVEQVQAKFYRAFGDFLVTTPGNERRLNTTFTMKLSGYADQVAGLARQATSLLEQVGAFSQAVLATNGEIGRAGTAFAQSQEGSLQASTERSTERFAWLIHEANRQRDLASDKVTMSVAEFDRRMGTDADQGAAALAARYKELLSGGNHLSKEQQRSLIEQIDLLQADPHALATFYRGMGIDDAEKIAHEMSGNEELLHALDSSFATATSSSSSSARALTDAFWGQLADASRNGKAVPDGWVALLSDGNFSTPFLTHPVDVGVFDHLQFDPHLVGAYGTAMAALGRDPQASLAFVARPGDLSNMLEVEAQAKSGRAGGWTGLEKGTGGVLLAAGAAVLSGAPASEVARASTAMVQAFGPGSPGWQFRHDQGSQSTGSDSFDNYYGDPVAIGGAVFFASVVRTHPAVLLDDRAASYRALQYLYSSPDAYPVVQNSLQQTLTAGIGSGMDPSTAADLAALVNGPYAQAQLNGQAGSATLAASAARAKQLAEYIDLGSGAKTLYGVAAEWSSAESVTVASLCTPVEAVYSGIDVGAHVVDSFSNPLEDFYISVTGQWPTGFLASGSVQEVIDRPLVCQYLYAQLQAAEPGANATTLIAQVDRIWSAYAEYPSEAGLAAAISASAPGVDASAVASKLSAYGSRISSLVQHQEVVGVTGMVSDS